MNLAVLLALTLAGCVYAASATVLPDLIMIALPSGRVEGDGKVDEAARTRIAERKQAALAEATRDAITAADHAPRDLRLQRRAAAMVRQLGARSTPKGNAESIEPVLARLAEGEPCPGLADVAATYRALGDDGRAGDAYMRAAHTCGSVDAAIAAVAPFKAASRCDDAIALLRAMWPKVELAHRDSWIAVLDGVAACSDALTLRRNLSFAPEDIIADYFDLLAAREREAERERQREEAQRLQEQAESQAREARWQCQSECGAAVSSCESSCAGDVHCLESCSSVGHVCRAGCGA